MAQVQYAMAVDMALCVGCNACTVACALENALPEGKFNTWVESWDAGEYPAVKRANLPHLCNHCADAPCVNACPTGASFIEENGGVVLIDESRCIGCKACMAACPYNVRWVNEASGTVEKCTFCVNRAEAGLLPACVATCPSHARMFGNLNDLSSDVALMTERRATEVLYPEAGCEAHVYYIGLEETLAWPVTSGVSLGGRVVKPLGE